MTGWFKTGFYTQDGVPPDLWAWNAVIVLGAETEFHDGDQLGNLAFNRETLCFNVYKEGDIHIIHDSYTPC